jgi:hypothetical protein
MCYFGLFGREKYPQTQYMAIVIHDELADRWICLKLSTLRRIIKYLAKQALITSRPLSRAECYILARIKARLKLD